MQAVITPQGLQIAGISLPNWPFTGCLVSILPLESVQSHSSLAVIKSSPHVRAVQETYFPHFRQRPMSDIG